MSLGIIPEDKKIRTLEFPPQKLQEGNRSTRRVILIGTLVTGIITLGGYVLSQKQERKGISELDEITQNIGKIPGVEHIHLSK